MPSSISAVRAIGVAGQAGQKIFNITRAVYESNPYITDTALIAHSASTRDRVAQALAAGYEVVIHEAPVAQDGWVGTGMIFIDPATGAGAYLIEGGSNGSWLTLIIAALFGLVDSLTKKLRSADSMFGPYDEIRRANFIRLLGAFASLLSFASDVYNIVTNDDLSTPKKVAQIIFTLAFAIVAMEVAALIGVACGPVLAVVLAVSFALIMAYLLLELNNAIAEL